MIDTKRHYIIATRNVSRPQNITEIALHAARTDPLYLDLEFVAERGGKGREEATRKEGRKEGGLGKGREKKEGTPYPSLLGVVLQNLRSTTEYTAGIAAVTCVQVLVDRLAKKARRESEDQKATLVLQ